MQSKSGLETLKKNKESNSSRIRFTQSEIELLASEKEKLQQEFEILDVKNAELEDSYNGLTQRRDQYRDDVQHIKEEINRLEKDHLQKQNSINLIKEKINSSNTALRNLKASGTKLENTIKLGEQEILQLENDIRAFEEKEKTLGSGLNGWKRLKEDLEKVVEKQEKEYAEVNARIKELSADLNTKRKVLEEIKDNKKQIEINLSSIKKDLIQLQDVAFKEMNIELDHLADEDISAPEFENLELSELEKLVEESNERMIRMRDSNKLNFSAESEFELLSRDYNFLLTQKEDVVKSIEDMNEAINKIDEESRASFNEAFASIKANFEKNFEILFEGGEAELSIMEPENVLESGLEIKAQPPGKRLLSLKLLSGGEKTLTSLAFLFALFEYKPSPFCVFDEVDASLDEANIQRFLKFLHKLKEKTQFLIITHNFKTMEEADYLYGISMNEPGISTIYSMKMTGKGKFEQA
jgi:chromosome segregation protein